IGLSPTASYWQASHSSNPTSPGRIMQTGPSASASAAAAIAGAATAGAFKPPVDDPCEPCEPKPLPFAPEAPPAPLPELPEGTEFNCPCATVDFSTCVAAIVRR